MSRGREKTDCLGGAIVRLLYTFETVERNDRTAVGAARFANDRDDAARAGLERT